jgi:ribonuclease HII
VLFPQSSKELQTRGLQKLRQLKPKYIIGIDEVGYGSWAGPVVVCAALVLANWSDPRVRDSKKYRTRDDREAAAKLLVPPTVKAQYILEYDNHAIDAMGLSNARDALAVRAAKLCLKLVGDAPVVMDGNQIPNELLGKAVCFPKADSLVPAVSAASVLAKVYRDNLMVEMHEMYPWYDFASNAGYGAANHVEGIASHGLCEIHRCSYQNIKQFAKQASQGRLAVARLLAWQRNQNEMHASMRSDKPRRSTRPSSVRS